MSTVLNVIYTPDKVRRLSFFAWSLLRWPDIRLRLVANGCTADERQHLQELSARNSRMTYLELPTTSMWLHGQALDYMIEELQDDIFGFIDSDIFTLSAEGSPALPEDCAAAFACPPPVWREAPRPKLVGCTYLSLYRRNTLRALMQDTGIGFNKQMWESVPAPVQQEVETAGFRAPRYDTGELLNVLLVARGERVATVPRCHLRHVGNYSAVTHRASSSGKESARVPKVHGPRWYLDSLLHGRLRAIVRHINRTRGKKERVNMYLNRMLDAVHAGRRPPIVPWYFPQPIRGQVKAITSDIVTLHAEFRRSQRQPDAVLQRAV